MSRSPNGVDIRNIFQWKSEYDSLLKKIAITDVFDTEWTSLRDIILFKVDQNVRQYLVEQTEKPEVSDARRTPEPLPRSSPISLPSSTPSPYTTSPAPPSVHQGLVIPPFPKRERRRDGPMRIYNSTMDGKEADELKRQIFEQLNEFDNAPFTIQRVCELCIQPKKHYKTVGKYLRAVQRTILVTSTWDTFPTNTGDDEGEMVAAYSNMEAMRLASTPLMSPIPFLHDDARRSRSPSPFELAATRHPTGSSADLDHPSTGSRTGPPPLGLVDELDDPKPGHLADRPTPLTSVASKGPVAAPPLSERFIKSSSPQPEEESKDLPETAESRQAEDEEVEDMVLDNTLEDEDKENRPS